MARPRVEIYWVAFDRLFAIQCTQAEIAAWFKRTDETINNAVKREQGMTFSQYYEEAPPRARLPAPPAVAPRPRRQRHDAHLARQAGARPARPGQSRRQRRADRPVAGRHHRGGAAMRRLQL